MKEFDFEDAIKRMRSDHELLLSNNPDHAESIVLTSIDIEELELHNYDPSVFTELNLYLHRVPWNEKELYYHHTMMIAAYNFASLSYCNKRRVGAIITKDKNILAYGYNGTPSGFKNVCEYNGTTIPYVLHAEANAITKVAKSTQSTQGSTIYCTTSPCIECSKLIIQAGITEVIISELYHDTTGLLLLLRAGITIRVLES